MQIIEVNPKECIRWKYADRAPFEFGDLSALAIDIKLNGQVEPVILRSIQDQDKHKHDKIKYEIIAGSRRWKACLEAGLPLKATIHNINDEQAAITQIKENQNLDICDYSKGIYYHNLIKDKKINQEKLAKSLNITTSKFKAYLYFAKIPQTIWDAVGNLTKITSRSAYTIYSLSQKGEQYISALIDIADEIRKGAGCNKIEKLVAAKISNNSIVLNEIPITLSSGISIGTFKNNIIKLNKELEFNTNNLIKHLTKFFEYKYSKK